MVNINPEIHNKMSRMGITYNPLSYGVFLNDMQKFRRSGGISSDEFNVFDTPSQKYFKIFFYFFNGTTDPNNTSANDLLCSSGLLAPTWQLKGEWKDDDYWMYTSAWSYLMLNDDVERAELLKKFIMLLSNISTYSPWYFSSIEGFESAIDRSAILNEKEFKIPEEHRKITIKCLPDAYDNRIGTLLDLYKTIAYSRQVKKEILPANLRKFDMGIYVFESPIHNIHGNVNTKNDKITRSMFGESSKDDANKYNYATIGDLSASNYLTSYKYYEFHNCEINPSSYKSGWSTLNNVDGTTPEYSIEIMFDDCYEYGYNELLMRSLGDVIVIDSLLHEKAGEKSVAQADNAARLEELYKRSDLYTSGTFADNVISEITGSGARFLKNRIKKITLGNIFSLSLSKLKDQIGAFEQGHTWNVISSAKSYIDNATLKHNASRTKALGNIFKGKSIGNNI